MVWGVMFRESALSGRQEPVLDEPFDESGSVVDRFDAIARRFPSRPAVQDTHKTVTYRELQSIARRITAALAAAPMVGNGPVAILLPSDVTLPAAMLGVLAAGRAYVALDPGHPHERNNLILAEAGASAIVSLSALAARARIGSPQGVPVISIDRLSADGQAQPASRPRPDDLATISFTSGSTGQPKGVALDHRGLMRRIATFTAASQITCTDRLALLASPSVSTASRTIYGALLNGASLHILPPLVLGVPMLVQQLKARGITHFNSGATLLRRIAKGIAPGERLECVRIAGIRGERLLWNDVDICRRVFSRDVAVHTGLSSTETGPFIQGTADEGLRAETRHPPLGRPVQGWDVTIVDPGGKPVADGAPGEIVVSGRFIARGYWRGRAGRVESFPVDPANPDARIYRTGDHGVRRPDGLIEFIGRSDQQIKLHGQRIELGEIEAALQSCSGVHEAAALARRDSNGVARSIVAYVVLEPGTQGLLPRHLQTMLAHRLPRHMVPARICLVEQLPRLSSLKIDRQALARRDAERVSETRDEDSDPLVRAVAGVLETIIGVSGATSEDTVASLGGDSLEALNVFAELERRYGAGLLLAKVDMDSSIGALARWIAREGSRGGSVIALS